MGEFRSTIQQRLRDAQASLRTAQAHGDDYAADTHQAEIDELRRLAVINGVAV